MKKLNNTDRLLNLIWSQWGLIFLFLILCACIGFADFSTKGEPREALVAADMLRSGNWILPIDLSGDMAYKPPMFHWLIAIFSLPAGHVTEFTARIPSALALTLLSWITAIFCCGRDRQHEHKKFGILATLLMLTCFEIFRAGTVCRVDMLLTLFIVSAMYFLFRSCHSDKRLLFLLTAILCMSGGTLTKGPVAILLPLGSYWIYRLIKKDNFLKTTGICLCLMIVAIILPALWYYAAYEQGGDKFLKLAMEENFGRFLGHMTYDSHIKPLWYNFTSLLSGWLPWSLILLLSLILLRKTKINISATLRHPLQSIRNTRPEAMFAIIAAIVIFIFYCIPKSKRSVYLLPMYPFMAYGIALYATCLIQQKLLKATTLKRLISATLILFILGFGAIFPIYSKHDSDKIKAAEISDIIPSGPIYSFIPARFMRYYITDFYLGQRIVSLLPSGQVSDSPKIPDASQMRLPDAKTFYLLTSADFIKHPEKDHGLHNWLHKNNLASEILYTSDSKTHDVRSPLILLKIYSDTTTKQSK